MLGTAGHFWAKCHLKIHLDVSLQGHISEKGGFSPVLLGKLQLTSYLFVWLWWAGWSRCPRRGCEALCRIHDRPPRPSRAGASAAQLTAPWWERSGSWTAGRNMPTWITAHICNPLLCFRSMSKFSLADSGVRTWWGVVFSLERRHILSVVTLWASLSLRIWG